MSKWLIRKFESINPFHLVWITVLVAEVLTAISNSILSLAFWGFISHDLLLIGSIDAFFVSLIAATLVVYFLTFLRDIREEQRLTQERMRAQKLESIGILAGGIAHDFNNSLTAILNNISLARLNPDPAKADIRLAKAEQLVFKAKSLTQQLLTFSRGGAPVKEPASLKELVRVTTDFVLSGSNVNCEYVLPDDLWPVNVDSEQISRVINNLVINAIQAMPEGGSIDIWAENVSCEENELPGLGKGRYVRLSLKDTGIGIPAENLGKIFDPYFTTKEGGSGLGLATAYSIIKKHDGHIDIDSVLGEGTLIRVCLPAAERTPPPETADTQAPLSCTGKVLIMDDDEYIRESVEEWLDFSGHEAVFAKDGDEAVRLYREAMDLGAPFDVVILDLTIRGAMGGRETVKMLLDIDPDVKAVVSSGYSNDPVMTDIKKYGFLESIAKPYRLETMDRVLKRLIGAKERK